MTGSIACVWGRAGHLSPPAESLWADAAAGGEAAAIFRPGVTPALRLNTDGGRRYRPEALADLADNPARLAALHDRVARQADLFSRSQRLFLETYFGFVREAVEAHASEIAPRLAWSGGLFEPADLVFSALRPLPRARIAAKDGPVEAADFAFWDGEAVIAVSVSGAAAAKGPDENNASRPVRHVRVTPAELAAGTVVFSDRKFPETIRRFFAGVDVPEGPFRPHGLAESLSPA